MGQWVEYTDRDYEKSREVENESFAVVPRRWRKPKIHGTGWRKPNTGLDRASGSGPCLRRLHVPIANMHVRCKAELLYMYGQIYKVKSIIRPN